MAATTVVTRASKGSALTHTEMDTNWNNLLGGLMYVGSIVIWPSATLPDSKWLELDGSSKSTASYPDLFALIGYTYGGSAGNFNLPDLRGQFVRGWNHGATKDPDAASRTDRGDTTVGDNVGTKQGFALQNITGAILGGAAEDGSSASGAFAISGVYGGGPGGYADNGFNFDASRVAATSTETRPTNIQLMYIIKALK